MEEIKGSLSIDGVRSHEGFHLAAVAQAEPDGVEKVHLRGFPRDGFIRRHAVEMASFDHERPRGDQRGHLGVVEGAAEIELEDFILAAPDVAVAPGRAGGGGDHARAGATFLIGVRIKKTPDRTFMQAPPSTRWRQRRSGI